MYLFQSKSHEYNISSAVETITRETKDDFSVLDEIQPNRFISLAWLQSLIKSVAPCFGVRLKSEEGIFHNYLRRHYIFAMN